MDIIEAAASGDRMATLVALRDEIARTIQSCGSGRDMAALSKRLIEVMGEIDALRTDEDSAQFDEVLADL